MAPRQDLTQSQLSETAARKLCAAIRARIDDVRDLVLQLYRGGGWQALGYTCWKQCCEEEFGKSASWASRQIKWAEVESRLPIGNDVSESVARELNRAPAGRQAEALDQAQMLYGKTPTAAQVRDVVEEIRGDCPHGGAHVPDEDGDCRLCGEPNIGTSDLDRQEPVATDAGPGGDTDDAGMEAAGAFLDRTEGEARQLHNDHPEVPLADIVAGLRDLASRMEDWL